jgi:hypothetical protein
MECSFNTSAWNKSWISLRPHLSSICFCFGSHILHSHMMLQLVVKTFHEME